MFPTDTSRLWPERWGLARLAHAHIQLRMVYSHPPSSSLVVSPMRLRNHWTLTERPGLLASPSRLARPTFDNSNLMASELKTQDLLLSFHSAYRTQVATLAEAHISDIAFQKCPRFVRAFEGGMNDCCIYLGALPIGETGLERLLTVEDRGNAGEGDLNTRWKLKPPVLYSTRTVYISNFLAGPSNDGRLNSYYGLHLRTRVLLL